MVDTISIRLHRKYVTQTHLNQLQNLIPVWYKAIKPKKINGHTVIIEYQEGKFNNITIRIFSDRITLHGSLPKMVFGNNVQGIPFNEIGKALKQLAEGTGLPIFKGELARVDIAECFVVSRNTGEYFQHLLDTPGFKHVYNPSKSSDGVRYERESKELAFYNKTNDAIKVQGFTPSPGDHVIRIELRIKRNVRRTVFNKRTKFGCVYLLSHSFLRKLASLWFKTYIAINKRRETSHEMEANSMKAYELQKLASAIRKDGLNQCMSELDGLAKATNWPSSKKSKAVARLKRLYNSDNNSRPNKRIAELDQLVKQGEIYNYASV